MTSSPVRIAATGPAVVERPDRGEVRTAAVDQPTAGPPRERRTVVGGGRADHESERDKPGEQREHRQHAGPVRRRADAGAATVGPDPTRMATSVVGRSRWPSWSPSSCGRLPDLPAPPGGQEERGKAAFVRSCAWNPHDNRRTLLGVWAHPDDEAYLSAGLMAEFRRRGDRVVVVTATLGEHGTSDPRRGRRRGSRRSGTPSSATASPPSASTSSACSATKTAAATATTAPRPSPRVIAEIEPDLIVTFGPDGMTGHPDHRAISRWTTDAWAATRPAAVAVVRDAHARVPPAVGPDQRPDRFVGRSARAAVHRCRTTWHGSTRLADDLLDLKIAALEAHDSQTRPLIELVGRATYREWWRTESFRGASAPTADERSARSRPA